MGAFCPGAGATYLVGVSLPFLARIFRAFRYRDFRLMWFGACASTVGTFVQQFAQSWLVYDITKDPFYLGLDLFLGQLPIIMFSLFGGVFADRLDRRKMLLTSQYIQMACAFLLAFLFSTHVLHVWQICPYLSSWELDNPLVVRPIRPCSPRWLVQKTWPMPLP